MESLPPLVIEEKAFSKKDTWSWVDDDDDDDDDNWLLRCDLMTNAAAVLLDEEVSNANANDMMEIFICCVLTSDWFYF